jgi:hypothetical protein
MPARYSITRVGRPRVEQAHVEDTAHVLALEPGCCLPLTQEALHGLLLLQRVGEEELDRHRHVENEMVGTRDDSHAALGQDMLDAIFLHQYRARFDHGFLLHRSSSAAAAAAPHGARGPVTKQSTPTTTL